MVENLKISRIGRIEGAGSHRPSRRKYVISGVSRTKIFKIRKNFRNKIEFSNRRNSGTEGVAELKLGEASRFNIRNDNIRKNKQLAIV